MVPRKTVSGCGYTLGNEKKGRVVPVVWPRSESALAAGGLCTRVYVSLIRAGIV